MTQTARAALAIRLAFYCDDDAEAARLALPEALELAFESNETQRIGLLAGSVAAFYDAVGRRDEASALRSRAFRELRSVDFCFWLLDQSRWQRIPQNEPESASLLADAAGDRGHRAAVAYLSLFDARVASAKRAPQATELAEHAAASSKRSDGPGSTPRRSNWPAATPKRSTSIGVMASRATRVRWRLADDERGIAPHRASSRCASSKWRDSPHGVRVIARSRPSCSSANGPSKRT